MKPTATDWHGVALDKLRRVVGERSGEELAQAVLADLGIVTIASVEDLRRVATALGNKGGFAAAVGGLLSVHAALYAGEEPRLGK